MSYDECIALDDVTRAQLVLTRAVQYSIRSLVQLNEIELNSQVPSTFQQPTLLSSPETSHHEYAQANHQKTNC